MVEAAAAVFLGDQRGEKARLGQRRDEFASDRRARDRGLRQYSPGKPAHSARTDCADLREVVGRVASRSHDHVPRSPPARC